MTMASDVELKSYEACKEHALSVYSSRKADSQILLTQIKEKYEDVINSPRTFEYISDLRTLFKVLEKRNALTTNDMQVLEYIYGVLKINTKILENHKNIIKGNHTEATGGEDTENQAPSKTPSFHYPRNVNSENVSWEKVNSDRRRLSERVVTEISTRIGGSWQGLARYLKVQECDIHAISQDASLKTHEARTRAMLHVFEKRTIPQEVKIKLLKALRLAGRMDIHCDVNKLFLEEL